MTPWPLSRSRQTGIPSAGQSSSNIEVRRSDIFEPTEAHGFVPKLMNCLHFMTASSVISREILLKQGEPYDSADAAETARNLRTLGIFRRVRVDSATTDSGFVVKVFAQDGWSTQADVRFLSAGSQTDWQLALIEKNLVGTATRFAVRYRHTPDRTSWAFSSCSPGCWPAPCCLVSGTRTVSGQPESSHRRQPVWS